MILLTIFLIGYACAILQCFTVFTVLNYVEKCVILLYFANGAIACSYGFGTTFVLVLASVF